MNELLVNGGGEKHLTLSDLPQGSIFQAKGGTQWRMVTDEIDSRSGGGRRCVNLPSGSIWSKSLSTEIGRVLQPGEEITIKVKE